MEDLEVAAIDSLTRALDLHSLRILVAIAETGSISGAARSLGFSQPTITQHVQRLEARLGAALVIRSARSARLTPVGALLATHAPRIDASLTAAATDLADMLGVRAGSVRIAAPDWAIAGIVAPVLGRFATEDSGVRADFIEADADEAIDLIRAGRADIALTSRFAAERDRAARIRRDGLRSSFLFADEVVAIVRDDDATPADPRVQPSVLADRPWIGGAATASDQVVARLGASGKEPAYRVSSPQAALALVGEGLGIAFLAESSLAALVLPAGVRAVGLDPALTRRVLATTLVEAADIPAVETALRFLADRQPTATDLESLLDARRRHHALGHRSRFSVPAHRTTPPSRSPLESPDMSITLSRTSRASAAAAGALLLAACTSPQPGDEAEAATIESITVAMPGSLSSLYVGQEAGILNYYIASITQEGLVSLDADGALQPGLAESWEQVDDITYVYELRDDAKFQDGTPVTAEDVVFSLEQARDETLSPGLAYYLSGVDSIEQTGEEQVTITLTAPDAAFAKNMSTGGAAFITSKAFWDEHDGKVGTSEALLLGSGPYRVTDFVPDSHVSFERVDTWWGDLPEVEKIRVEFIPDESTRLLAAQSGDVDLAFNVPLAQSTQWEGLDTMRVEYVNDLSYVGMYFNTALAPFDDPKVREAFAHAVDRDAVVERVLRGHGEAATAIATPESLGSVYSADEARELLASIPQYDFDLDAAAKALAASTHPDGFEAELLTPSTGPQLGTAAQALAENLAKIGVTLNVREVPIEEWLASLDPGSEYGVGFMWYFSTLGDPAEVPSYLLGAGNLSNYENAEVIDLLAQAGAESDAAARIDLIVEAETLQAEDIVNVPLWWGQSATAFARELGMDEYSSFAFISAWPTALHPSAG
ncbi:ABC transporter substrate-binding protein [Agromyces sp. H66]|uniref:ABC transporter substrate-binding protein n=1 Tax=Agromyces sp. H66 TaxID=2529859 RepID=UPI0010AA425B|nr:ABC transporter substrate-binding protein [Agromyces sp. H66]